MTRKPLAGQMYLHEDPADIIVALNDDVKRSYHELLNLEDEREQRQGELDSFKATEVTYGDKLSAVEMAENRDWTNRKNELRGHVSAATKAVNKQKDKIIKQIGEVIDAAEGTQRVEPMQH